MKIRKFGLLASAGILFLTAGQKVEALSMESGGEIHSTSVRLIDGTAYAPVRDVLRALGDWEVSWDPSISSAKAESDLFTVTFPVGHSTVLLDGYGFDTEPIFLENGTTYVPLRTTANLLGAETVWNGFYEPIELIPRTTYRDHTEEDYYWMSRIISAESQGEILLGQLAVGNVVLNRVESAQFPNTIEEVIFDDAYAVQFEPVSVGSIYWEPTERSMLAAKMVLNGTEVIGEAMYFYAPALSEGTWINANRTYYKTIGCHKFYL